jgi:hypothetical protein
LGQRTGVGDWETGRPLKNYEDREKIKTYNKRFMLLLKTVDRSLK